MITYSEAVALLSQLRSRYRRYGNREMADSLGKVIMYIDFLEERAVNIEAGSRSLLLQAAEALGEHSRNVRGKTIKRD